MADTNDNTSDIEILEDSELADPREYLADLPSKLISSVLGFMGFLTACLVGLIAGNPGIVILSRAMVAMVVCVLIGRVLGVVSEICAREFIEVYRANNPEPEKPQELVDLENEKLAHESLVSSMNKAA